MIKIYRFPYIYGTRGIPVLYTTGPRLISKLKRVPSQHFTASRQHQPDKTTYDRTAILTHM